MLIGYPPKAEGEFRLECNVPGCGTKMMEVEIAIGPLRRHVSFAAVTYPRFEDPPLTRDNGADLAPDTVLRVKWDRLTFYGNDRLLGPIEIDLQNKPSYGRVHSLANPDLDASSWVPGTRQRDGGTFFPAHNENHLRFQVRLPRWRLTFENPEPVVNGAIITSIPPEGTEYTLKAPVRFRPRNLLMPFSAVLDRCRMSMSVLEGVRLSVVSFHKTGAEQARLVVRAENQSTVDEVRMGLVADSTANIIASPAPQFFDLDRSSRDVTIDLDISAARPPGVVVLGFVLVEPFESPGSNRITIDYDEIRLGRREDGVPVFTESGLQRSPLAHIPS